jgi:hypothetical protein
VALKTKAEAFKAVRQIVAEGNAEAIKAFLADLKDDSLNAKSVLDFFSALDEREAWRDASSHGGSSVYIGGAGRGQQDVSGVLAAMLAAKHMKDTETKPATLGLQG